MNLVVALRNGKHLDKIKTVSYMGEKGQERQRENLEAKHLVSLIFQLSAVCLLFSFTLFVISQGQFVLEFRT